MQNKEEKSQLPYAGFGPRLVAFGIDCFIVSIAQIILYLFIADISIAAEESKLGSAVIFYYILEDMIMYVPHAVYFVLCTYFTGMTAGKRIMNLRVVNKDGSSKLSLLNVIYRETVGRFLCKMSIGIGYLIAGFEPEKRGLHDILCDTQVICAKKVKIYEEIQKVPARTERLVTVGESELVEEPPLENNDEKCVDKLEAEENFEEEDVLGGYHLTDESKVDIVDEVNISENDL